VKFLTRLAAALASGGALAQVYGLHPLWWLAWLAPIPLLVAAMGATRRTAFLLGAIAGALSMGGLFSYLLSIVGPGVIAAFALQQAVLFGLFALFTRLAAERLPSFGAALVLPALLAAIETLTAQFAPNGSFGSLAYSQLEFLPVVQLASVGGAPAVTFLVALFASGLSLAIWKRRLRTAILPLLVVGGGLAWGLNQLPGPATVNSAAVHDDLPVTLIADDRFDGVSSDWRPVWDGYEADIARAARAGQRIIVLPEKIAQLSAADSEGALARFADIARTHDVMIVLGVDAIVGDRHFNRAYVFRPDAETLAYDKRHMIPGLESEFAPGPGSLSFEQGATRFGVAICKDMDFPTLGRDYPGVRVMLVPAWDFGVDGYLHSRMAMLRGVENGFTIVRSARNGLLTVSDRYGRVIAQHASGAPGVLTAYAPLGAPGPTLYERVGDAFGWAMCALALLLMALSLLGRRPAAPQKPEQDATANPSP
jgi:apolipoprotein N-acyltransferase